MFTIPIIPIHDLMHTKFMRTPFQRILLLLFACMAISLTADAQNPILRRAENRVRNRANREVDKAIDRSIDQILTEEKNENADSTQTDNPPRSQDSTDVASPNFGGFFGSAEDFEPYQNEYLVSFKADITVTNEDDDEESTAKVNYAFDTWATGLQMESEEGNIRLILDNQEGYMTTATTDEDGELQAYRMRQRSYEIPEEVENEGESKITVTRTGNTRVIDGYQCEEVIIEQEDGTITTAWMTTEIDLPFHNYMMSFSQRSGAKQGEGGPNTGNYYDTEGFPIESTTVSADGKETTFVHFHNILLGDDIDRSVFDLGDVEVTDLGF